LPSPNQNLSILCVSFVSPQLKINHRVRKEGSEYTEKKNILKPLPHAYPSRIKTHRTYYSNGFYYRLFSRYAGCNL